MCMCVDSMCVRACTCVLVTGYIRARLCVCITRGVRIVLTLSVFSPERIEKYRVLSQITKLWMLGYRKKKHTQELVV